MSGLTRAHIGLETVYFFSGSVRFTFSDTTRFFQILMGKKMKKMKKKKK